MDGWELLVALSLGVGLAAACGFRVFVPLLVMSLAARSGHLALASNLDWLASDVALVMLIIATVLEIGAYYIPWVDNLLDTIATPAAGIAGTIAAASVFGGMDPTLQWAVAAIAGGGAAMGVQAGTVGVRALSTAGTGGLGNPIVSTTEAGAATLLAVLAVVVPVIAAALVIAVLVSLVRFIFRRRRRTPVAPPAPTTPDTPTTPTISG